LGGGISPEAGAEAAVEMTGVAEVSGSPSR
jgi:hypothetical protein